MPSRDRRFKSLQKTAESCRKLTDIYRQRPSTPVCELEDSRQPEDDVTTTQDTQVIGQQLSAPVIEIEDCQQPEDDTSSEDVQITGSSVPSESTVPARQHDVQPHSSTTVCDNISQTTFSYNQPPSTPSLKRPRSVTDELGLTPVRKRQRHFSSHKIGFNSSWATDRPWLIKLVQTDEDGESYDSMICTLCRDHNVNGANGATAWSKTRCRTLRLDKVKDHEKSSQHREATQTALAAEEMETSTRNVYTLNETATQDAFKVLQHLIENNYALSNFQSMIQLCKNTGSESLTRFSIDDESKSHTSRTVVMEMLEIYSENIRKHLLDDIQQSPAFSLMVDEVTDVTTSKHLAMCVQFLSRDGEKKTAFLADPVIDHGDAETITETIRNQLQ